MTYIQSVVLGAVQGLTEFLPVSSSGHLILIPRLLGWPDQGLAFDATIHVGTLAALLVYFWPEMARMGAAGRDGGGLRRLAGLLLVATIPAGLAGLLFETTIESRLRAPWVVAASLIVWGLVMWGADRQAQKRRNSTTRLVEVGWGPGLAVGASQALSLIPGTSRSGITITAGLLVKMDRATAARFSFLLGIPITAAAGGAKMLELQRRSLLPFVLYRLGLGLLILGAS